MSRASPAPPPPDAAAPAEDWKSLLADVLTGERAEPPARTEACGPGRGRR